MVWCLLFVLADADGKSPDHRGSRRRYRPSRKSSAAGAIQWVLHWDGADRQGLSVKTNPTEEEVKTAISETLCCWVCVIVEAIMPRRKD
jgi:hypothetical protein